MSNPIADTMKEYLKQFEEHLQAVTEHVEVIADDVAAMTRNHLPDTQASIADIKRIVSAHGGERFTDLGGQGLITGIQWTTNGETFTYKPDTVDDAGWNRALQYLKGCTLATGGFHHALNHCREPRGLLRFFHHFAPSPGPLFDIVQAAKTAGVELDKVAAMVKPVKKVVDNE